MNQEQLSAVYRAMVAARSPESRAACVTPEALLALVERAGPEATRLVALDHVMACGRCLEEFELLRAVRGGADVELRRVRTTWWGPVAAAALVTLVVGGMLWNRTNSRRASEVERGGLPRFVAVAPNGEIPQPAGELRFTWMSVSGATAYDLRLELADGQTIYTATTGDTVLTLPDSVRMLAGRPYEWKVAAHIIDGTTVRSAITRFTMR